MKIGIIGAMDYEITLLIEAMTEVETKCIAGREYHKGLLMGKSVVAVVSGIGKVNAALCAQILVSEFEVTHVINTGVSGAVKDHLEVGDTVISIDLLEHDMDATGFGYEYGQIPGMDQWIFVADEKLRKLAYEAAKHEIKDHAVYEGRIVTGDQFVSSMERKDFLLNQFNADTTEMEGAAIAHVCHVNKVPFVIIRAMSDKADGSAHVNFEEFGRQSAINSSKIVLDMMKGL
ncbi:MULTISPECIES: 5'-methylthioadenosine/adenosylhomocysteine nucleosidase [unclassified Fusibacter]|uniref:5'-methylthioadenosine/adenosylhomocysteine nucleosidase n=1 Tax=unclassified Fusibacter TaxID=2624464 RepID=UPI001012A5FA|nr:MULTISPECIES: 5'-methylthioadenosine/adenosylhomocysteine nucleosidase [unclassified Fusibacter]MCK8058032.1 5'-methylthioadenosine/adenosylhomocysteine nucleosidase [Fusibacter sp. A2]NPE20614.1 5'-methylthioadenosine/adenosylhomocysteine nucleosidase [Fusibacter sp. A1]RXV62821.1 5'-methylthioadenosine/adenosylhomocysteine nucleosidase [Fusibacter sp. A1]